MLKCQLTFAKSTVNTFWSNYTDCIKDIPNTYRQFEDASQTVDQVGK